MSSTEDDSFYDPSFLLATDFSFIISNLTIFLCLFSNGWYSSTGIILGEGGVMLVR